jgi:hypothetical protein
MLRLNPVVLKGSDAKDSIISPFMVATGVGMVTKNSVGVR